MNPAGVRRYAVALVVAAAVLGLSGCFKANQDLEIRADGTGSVVLHLEVNKRAATAIARSLDLTGGAPVPIDDPFRAVDRTFPDGTKVLAVNTADKSTVDASFDFNGPDDYSRKLQQVEAAIALDPTEPMSEGTITVTRAGDQMDVALGLGSSTAGTEDFDFSGLVGVLDPEALPSAVITITMPGSILRSNGEEDGRTVKWNLLSPTAPDTLTVSSTVEKAGLPGWALPALGGVLLALLLAILAALLVQRRRAAKATEPVVPYQPGPWQPAGGPGTGTFLPSPPGLPPRQPVGWPPSQPQPQPFPGTEPATEPGSWLPPQTLPPPPSGGPAPRPDPTPWPAQPGPWLPPQTLHPPPSGPAPGPSEPSAGWPPSGGSGPAGLPPRQPVAAPSPGSPWSASPPDHPDAGPEAPPADPPRWRVPGATAEVDSVPEPTASAPAAIEAGWYADPAGGGGARYWDGRQWTQHTR